MVLYKDRRLFKRYQQKTDFYITLDGNYYKAATVDFSLSGLCIFVEGKPHVEPDSFIDMKIEDLELDVRGRVVWIKDAGSNLLLGIEKMSLSGLLKLYTLSDILLDLQRSDFTGILEIENGPIQKSIYIKNGVMVFAFSNQEEDRLGEMMIRAGKLSTDRLYQALGISKATGKRLGAVLVELGFLKPDELILILKYQVEEIILSLFTWEDGEIKFIDGPLPDELILIKLSAANLIFRGIKRVNKPEYFKNVCPHPDTILYFSNEPLNLFQDIQLAEEDRYVLALLDSKLTLKEITDISRLGRFRTTKIICALIGIRMIEVKGERILDDQTIIRIIKEPRKDIDSAFIDKVEDFYKRYKYMDYYGILGIDKNSSEEQIRKAYYLFAKEFHPDRHFQTGSETLKNQLNEIFTHVTEAYKILSDPKLKAQYDQTLKVTLAAAGMKSETQTARTRFKQGVEAFKRGDFAVAVELFGQAVYIDSRTGEYYYYLGLAYGRLKRFRDAQKAISKALELEPDNANYIAENGIIYLGLGFHLRAKSVFEKALKLDPHNKKAKEGLSRIRIGEPKVDWV
jgi:curved DNA-binding protein CbpA